jgi:DNA-binding CsgD family transcriptional regulator
MPGRRGSALDASFALAERKGVEGRAAPTRLTSREREIAGLIALGLTNKQIGGELAISERTAEAHVQNILNKLGVNNRAQIAAWASTLVDQPARGSAHRTAAAARPPEVAAVPAATAASHGLRWIAGLFAAVAVVVAVTDDSPRLFIVGLASRGPLIYDAKLTGDGEGISPRYFLDDPAASSIRFVPGAIEYRIVSPFGVTGNSLIMQAVPRYYAEVQVTVVPGSNVTFWFQLDPVGSEDVGQHLVALRTQAETLQLEYSVRQQNPLPLSPQVDVEGLQDGRTFNLGVLVDPPRYGVFLDGRIIIDARHAPTAAMQSPSFRIFGDSPGLVRLTSIRAWSVGVTA